MKLWYPYTNVKVWAPSPTWPTHHFIANGAHFQSDSYRYYDANQKCFKMEWMVQDLDKLPEK